MESAPRSKEQQLLSRVVIGAIREPLGSRANYLLAGLAQDRAERAEAGLRRQASQGKETKNAARNAADAWKNARSGWNRYLERNNLGPSLVVGQLEAIRQRRQRGALDSVVAALEYLQLELHLYASARLQASRAQDRLGVKIGDSNEALAAEIRALADRDGPLAKEIEACREMTSGGTPMARHLRRRLDYLNRDFGPAGYFDLLLRQTLGSATR